MRLWKPRRRRFGIFFCAILIAASLLHAGRLRFAEIYDIIRARAALYRNHYAGESDDQRKN